MEKPTIEQIHAVMKGCGMTVFTQPYSVTLGGIRTKDNTSNKFNDWLFSSYFDHKGIVHSIIVPGTVDAGITYRIKPINPKGTGIIQHGIQHKGVYQYQDPAHNKGQLGHNGQEAFRQIKPMSMLRDNDKDPILDFDGPTEISLSFTNGHDMGDVGKDVNNWSAGCWGAIRKWMDLLYAHARTQVSHGLGDKFSYAMLHEDMF